MPQIQAGDLVKVKSGGPEMTVARVFEHHGDIKAVCIWFPNPADLKEKSLDIATLQKVEDE